MRYLQITTLFCILCITSCGIGPWAKDNEPTEPVKSEKLFKIEKSLKETYCPQAISNWSKADKFMGCDSALFAGLLSIACEGVDVSKYEDANNPGRMCRSWNCDCFSSGNSASSYSKDMDAGIRMSQAFKTNLSLSERIIKYLDNNNLRMCHEEYKDEATRLSRCVMPPGTLNQWRDITDKAKETNLIAQEVDGSDGIGTKTGFQAHLAVLGSLTQGLIYGKINDFALKEIKTQASREPENALYLAANAIYGGGSRELAADAWMKVCPLDRLPTKADHCSDYLWQRDQMVNGEVSQDWNVCPGENETHPGVDCAIAAWAILYNPNN